MKFLTLRLQDAKHTEDVAEVTSFIGEDQSGSFGILPGHVRFITVLVTGLARFCIAGRTWKYLAVPGAVLYLDNDVLIISTRHYLIDEDYNRISLSLKQELLAEEERLLTVKNSLKQMEEAVFKRLWELSRQSGG